MITIQIANIFERLKPYLSDKAIEMCNNKQEHTVYTDQPGEQKVMMPKFLHCIHETTLPKVMISNFELLSELEYQRFAKVINYEVISGRIKKACFQFPFAFKLATVGGQLRVLMGFYAFGEDPQSQSDKFENLYVKEGEIEGFKLSKVYISKVFDTFNKQ